VFAWHEKRAKAKSGHCTKSLELRPTEEFYSAMKSNRAFLLLDLLFVVAACRLAAAEPEFVSLFTEDGAPKGWLVRAWDELRNPAQGDPAWKVAHGVLPGGVQRGSWLLSET